MAFEQDWAFLQAALPDLQDYVLSNELFWPLRLTAHTPGSLQTPQLTIGNLLLSVVRLSSVQSQPDELNRITQQIQRVREAWRSNWSRKAGREFTSRLNLWEQYVREGRGDRQLTGYANQVRQRAILSLLEAEILEGVPKEAQEQLRAADSQLLELTHPGAFVWETELQQGFPLDDFWFLYRSFGS